MEENVRVLTIAELIRRARPLTGTFSLHSHFNRPISRSSNHRTRPGSINPNPYRNSKILTPLTYPAILIGTLTLNCSHDNCLQFTDSSSKICCDILDFNVRAIGKIINVTAWNFFPLKRGTGFLEIIRWNFPESTSIFNECSSADSFNSFPLISSFSSASETDTSKSRHRIHGALESISPVSIVPCSRPGSSTESTNIRGFLVRVMACGCKLWGSKESKLSQECHSFAKPEFIYFCGDASCWHPVMMKLVGKVIMISGLKKKLVFIGREESQMMYLTTENSVLHVPRLSKKLLPVSKTVIKGKGECGAYTGVVKGVYMQGMVVELDNEVWLLLTDKLLSVPHSLRLGAVISVRNVHFVNPRFSWAKILILGACCKTSIIVESFSPLESGCYINAESQSLLGKFIDSLSFSARLWALLVVSCFQKEFSGILLDKEIMGSKHEQGMAQMYVSSRLPSPVIRARHGVLTEFSKHESCSCGSEPYCGNLRLVVPISSFIYHCKATWIQTLLELDNNHHILSKNKQFCPLSCEGKFYGQSKRRIFSSGDIGIVLIGSLKISPSSGRLQLVDMTGSIDAIIPDLSSTWKVNSIYEVIDYVLMVEGLSDLVDRLGLPKKELLSCRTIFNRALLERKGNFPIFLYLYMHNASGRNLPFYPCVEWTDDFKELESGKFHLIRVTHKFPLLQKFQGDPLVENRSSVFVEAIVLPWNLFFSGKDGTMHQTKVLSNCLSESMEHCTGEDFRGHAPDKRYRTDYKSSRVLSSGLTDDLGNADSQLSTCSNRKSGKERKCRNSNFSHEIPCLATIRSANNCSLASSGILCYTKGSVKSKVDYQNLTAKKVLLEFGSENLSKYQLLQIGGYYLSKHHMEDPFCNIKDSDNVSVVKAPITSRMQMWSLTFSVDEVITHNRPSHDLSLYDSSFSSCNVLPGDEGELLLYGAPGSSSGTCSDVYLSLSPDAGDILKVNLKDLEEDFIKPCIRLEETSNSSSCSCTTLTSTGLLSRPDSNCLFPEGNLISLHGDVVAFHGFDDNSVNVDASCESLRDVLRLGFFQDLAMSFCIHVLVDRQPVRVFGSLSEHVYLTGFGPGVNATFHRVLHGREPDSLMLLPVSFVVVNSVRIVNDPYVDRSFDLWSGSDISNIAPLDTVSSTLISELIPSSDCSPMHFRCRVVAVHVLILEKKNRTCDDLHSKFHSKAHLFDIPLAGFVLDDGSSSCCCWADAEQAATLLRLHEKLPQSALENSGWALNWIGIDNNAWTTTIYHLERILKKHDRITVKNYGSIADSCYQDLTVSVSSENALTNSDENLLKFIIFNACFGTFWTVVASAMDSSAVQWLEKKHLKSTEMTMHSMQNIWASEVYRSNPITEARSMIQELLGR